MSRSICRGSRLVGLSLLAVVAALWVGSAHAQSVVEMIKANNTDALNQNSSWTPATPFPDPNFNEYSFKFDGTLSVANTTLELGGSLSPVGLVFSNLNGPVTINDSLGLNTLTLGAYGIDASAANQNVTINCAVLLTTGPTVSQTFNVGAGRILTMGGNGIANAGLDLASLIKSGDGTLNFNAVNTYSGYTQINAGTLLTSIGSSLGNANNILTLAGGTLDLGTTTQTAGAVSITAAATSGDTITNGTLVGTSFAASNASGEAVVNAVLAGSGATLNKSGAGTLTLKKANTFTGNTTIAAGTLQLGDNLALQNSTLDTSGVGTLAFSSGVNTPTFGGLTGSTALTLASNVTGLTLNPGTGVTQTYSGALSGAAGMSVTKDGAGTQILAGSTTYPGAFIVNVGTLEFAGASATPSAASITMGGGTISIDSGVVLTNRTGVFVFNATSSIADTTSGGSITLGSSANITVDPASVTGTIATALNTATAGQTITKNGAGKLIITKNVNMNPDGNGGNAITVQGGGTLEISGGLTSTWGTPTNRGYGALNVGSGSSGYNTVRLNGGYLQVGQVYLGADSVGHNVLEISSGNGNSQGQALTTGRNSGQYQIGINSSYNIMTISNGALAGVSTSGGTDLKVIGVNAGANYNSVTVTGTGSGWRALGGGSDLKVGDAGSFNSLTASAGGYVYSRRFIVGIGNGTVGTGSDNAVLVTGHGSQMYTANDSNAVFQVGAGTNAARNSWTVQDGASANLLGGGNTGRAWSMGASSGANDNYIRVTGIDSLGTPSSLTISNTSIQFVVGGSSGPSSADGGSGNHIDVYDGATATLTNLLLRGTNSSLNIGNGTANTAIATVGYSNSAQTQCISLSTASASLNFNNGKLVSQYNAAYVPTIPLVSGLGTVNLNGTATIDTAGRTHSIDSVIAGTTSAGTLTKAGTGTLTLTAANTYIGQTNVNGGTLALSGSSSNNIASSIAVNIANTATLDVTGLSASTLVLGAGQNLAAKGTGTATLTGSLDVGGRTLDLSDSTNIGTLAISGGLALSSATLKFDLGTIAGVSDKITIGGAPGFTGTANSFAFTGVGSLLATGTHAYTLMTTASGLSASAFATPAPLSIGGTSYSFGLDSDGSNLYLNVTAGTGSPTQLFTRNLPAGTVNAHINSTIDLNATLSNTGSGNLAAALSNTGTLLVDGLASTSDPVVNGTPATVTGTIHAGATAGMLDWQVTNSDFNATNPSEVIGGTVNVYTGTGVWATTGTAAWSNFGSWTADGGAPGLATGFQTGGDTATFNGAGGTVTLDASPVVGSVTFNSASSYTIAAGGGTLHFAGGAAAIHNTLGSHSIAAPVQLDSTVTATVSGATDTLTIGGAISGVGGIHKAGPGNLVLGGASTYTGTTAINNGMLELGTSAGANVLANYTNIAGVQTGGVDITASSKVVLDGASATTIEGILKAGAILPTPFSSGQIRSSTAGLPANNRALGWASDAGKVTVMYTLYGDATMDGVVNFDDLSKVLTNYNNSGNWSTGDVTYDGTVNFDDLSKVLTAYNTSIGAGATGNGAPTFGSTGGFTVVPEPSSVVLLVAGLMGLMAYGWRKRR